MSKDTRAAAGANATTDDEVRRNEFGGVYVDEEELKAAFDFFDVGKKGTLTPADLNKLWYQLRTDNAGQHQGSR